MNEVLICGAWEDCQRAFPLPYKDFEGHWQMPRYTQRRPIFVNGKRKFQYRERHPTPDEWSAEVW